MKIRNFAVWLGIFALFAAGGFCVYSTAGSAVEGDGGLLFIGIVLILIAVGLIFLKRRSSQPVDHTDPVYLELRALFREKLIPLNFQEEESQSLGYALKYTRGHAKISINKDIRDRAYFFATSNPRINFAQPLENGDQFKADAIEKFEEWLAMQ